MKWLPPTDWGDDTSGGYTQVGQREDGALIQIEFYYDENEHGDDVGLVVVSEAVWDDPTPHWKSLHETGWIDYSEAQDTARQFRKDLDTGLMERLL